MPRLPMMPALQKSTSSGTPLSLAANRAACLVSPTSRGYSAFAPRSVPMTRQPSAAYCRASSWPRPLPAPVTRIVGMHVSQIDSQVCGRRSRRHLVEEIGDEAAVVRRVIDEVHQDLEARHPALAAADERERHDLVELGVGDAIAPGDVPGIHFLLRAPQLVERGMVLRIARAIAVGPSLQMRLED